MTTPKTWKERQNTDSFSSFISHHSSLQRRARFTLIELLVVVAIIAILAGMLMPALNQAKKASLKAVCASNMKQIGLGIAGYVGDNKEWMPGQGVRNGIFHHLINEYVKAPAALTDKGSFNGMVAFTEKSMMVCPAAAANIKKTWKGSTLPAQYYYSNYRGSQFDGSDTATGLTTNEYAWGQNSTGTSFLVRIHQIKGNIVVGEKGYVGFPGASSGWCYSLYDKNGTATTQINDTDDFNWSSTSNIQYSWNGSYFRYGAGHLHDNSGNWLRIDGAVVFRKWQVYLLTNGKYQSTTTKFYTF